MSGVYRLLGEKGLPAEAAMPKVDEVVAPVGSVVRYHDRSGVHDVTAFDWEQYLNFLDAVFAR